MTVRWEAPQRLPEGVDVTYTLGYAVVENDVIGDFTIVSGITEKFTTLSGLTKNTMYALKAQVTTHQAIASPRLSLMWVQASSQTSWESRPRMTSRTWTSSRLK